VAVSAVYWHADILNPQQDDGPSLPSLLCEFRVLLCCKVARWCFLPPSAAGRRPKPEGIRAWRRLMTALNGEKEYQNVEEDTEMPVRGCCVPAAVDESVFWAVGALREGERKSAVKVQMSLARYYAPPDISITHGRNGERR
jgi:hypothetical protein